MLPVEYIKILLQTNTITEGRWKPHYATPYTGVGEAIRGIYKQSGVRGFFRGCWVMCLRDVPTSGVYVLSYELLRSSIPDIVGKEILAGGTAGIISLVPALPLDVIKTNIQTDNPKNPYYKGILDCIRKMYAKNGFPVFFTGLPILCMRAFPANAVMFTSYELLMAL
ncbi:hypothetical protein NQ317_004743 [Molorchus minor]|uniref:Uncharacterized protein n=1 Tax=Molorchus minor TaxID=1323400 RepID=A0ABQ9JND9_9CUCU|nr:hypothetical protein NQ317_004743 [Molorchus minor]